MIAARRASVVAISFCLLAGSTAAWAARQPAHLVGKSGLQVASGKAVRAHRGHIWDHVPPRAARGWLRFLSDAGADWRATWDPATSVPSRIFGAGVEAPGTIASAAAAADFARAFLARHVDLLAPGASPDDFVLASNHVLRGLRSVGFYQYHRVAAPDGSGAEQLRVIGGQVSFRFKNDRMFVIGSEALPAVRVSAPRVAVDRARIRERALAWVLDDAAATAKISRVEAPAILPLVDAAGVREYRVVHRVVVEAREPIGRWDVFVDATDGSPVARRQTLMFANATALYNVPRRHPGGDRNDRPARNAAQLVNGESAFSNAEGVVAWEGEEAVEVTARVFGPLVKVNNDAGAEATAVFTAQPDGNFTWDARDEEFVDAQLSAFIHGWEVKEYSRKFAADLEYLDAQLSATVNIDDICNAFSDGETINFYRADEQCENTGRLADVIYHEFGHSLHAQSILPGVGSFDSSLSEGLGDYLAATIQNDPQMGRGFFHTDEPLRDIDPEDKEHTWPDDVQEAHYTGLIMSGALWDLRKAMVEEYGYEAGVALTDRIFYAIAQRAADIPSSYVEALAEDDDDGDLANGTPNMCAINAAFALHGLRAINAELEPLSVEPPRQEGFRVSVEIVGLSAQCPGDAIAAASMNWRLRSDDAQGGNVVLAETDGAFAGNIPNQEPGLVVQYQVEVEFADGSTRVFPNNAADPWYEFFVGAVETIYCTDFETDPFAEGWTHALDAGDPREGADDWQWGIPAGTAGSGDPKAAHSGDHVIGNDLGGGEYNGSYQSDKINSCTSPAVDIGRYSDVRLQYWRWLNVEDAYYDHASIYANGELAWRNLNSDSGEGSSTHHQDREWRFHDVPLSSFISDGTVTIKFEIESDQGLELGGWTIDDFCIVGYTGSLCGDGEITGLEVCDDGAANSDTTPNACRESCVPAFCGDGVVDDGEDCDDGNDIEEDDCTTTCAATGADGDAGDCGCKVVGRGRQLPQGGALFVALCLAGLLLVRRRRQR